MHQNTGQVRDVHALGMGYVLLQSRHQHRTKQFTSLSSLPPNKCEARVWEHVQFVIKGDVSAESPVSWGDTEAVKARETLGDHWGLVGWAVPSQQANLLNMLTGSSAEVPMQEELLTPSAMRGMRSLTYFMGAYLGFTYYCVGIQIWIRFIKDSRT